MSDFDSKIRKHRAMTIAEAEKYIECLTFEEKKQLNEMLKSLEQMRRPSQALLDAIDEDD